MVMGGHLARIQSEGIFAAGFADHQRGQAGAIPKSNRRLRLEIGQGKVALAVASKVCAEQREQGGILRNGHELPAAGRPSLGREGETYHPDFPEILIGHGESSYGLNCA
jgi:hypothetical protein